MQYPRQPHSLSPLLLLLLLFIQSRQTDSFHASLDRLVVSFATKREQSGLLLGEKTLAARKVHQRSEHTGRGSPSSRITVRCSERGSPSPKDSKNLTIAMEGTASMFTRLHKLVWSSLTWIGNRRLVGFVRTLFPTYRETIFYFDTSCHTDSRGGSGELLVALTIDDGLSRNGSSTCMVSEVTQLLANYKAHATFFVCSDYCTGDEAMKQATRDLVHVHGHELGNHLAKDVSGYYSKLNVNDFRVELEDSNRVLEDLVNSHGSSYANDELYRVKWFRAPQGVFTSAMRRVLEERSPLDDPTNSSRKQMMHVLGDCYCDDWALACQDSTFVYQTTMRQVREGSILITHMPEKESDREAILHVLERLLRDLDSRGYRCVSVSEMWDACGKRHAHSSPT